MRESPHRDGSETAAQRQRLSTDRVGVAFTVLLAAAFFGFVLCGAYAPGLLAAPVVAGGRVTVAFAFGLFVIGLGVALTAGYVFYANRERE